MVERDALMTLWWIHRPAPRIDVDGPRVPYQVVERVMRLRRAGCEPELYDMTTEVQIPTVLCVLRAPRYPHLVISAATHGDAGRTCTKALDEVVLGRFVLRLSRTDAEAGNDTARPAGHTSGPVAGSLEHGRLYASDPRAPALDFLSGPQRGRDFLRVLQRSLHHGAGDQGSLCSSRPAWSARPRSRFSGPMSRARR